MKEIMKYRTVGKSGDKSQYWTAIGGRARRFKDIFNQLTEGKTKDNTLK